MLRSHATNQTEEPRQGWEKSQLLVNACVRALMQLLFSFTNCQKHLKESKHLVFL